ncbi:MAG: hypothetical protein CSA97_05730 [Bacteroidetes bacterium]|nr:MAG: hypothetical protein CSA97_05730 [Bacteroidota bacterium]
MDIRRLYSQVARIGWMLWLVAAAGFLGACSGDKYIQNEGDAGMVEGAVAWEELKDDVAFSESLLFWVNRVRDNPEGFAEEQIRPLVHRSSSMESLFYALRDEKRKLKPLELDERLCALAGEFLQKKPTGVELGIPTLGEEYDLKPGECIVTDLKSPREIVIRLLEDLGANPAIHREMVLDMKYNRLGVAQSGCLPSASGAPKVVLYFAKRKTEEKQEGGQ